MRQLTNDINLILLQLNLVYPDLVTPNLSLSEQIFKGTDFLYENLSCLSGTRAPDPNAAFGNGS